MVKNCSLGLPLYPISTSVQFFANCRQNFPDNPSAIRPRGLMVLYKGRLCVCDMTELQVRAIIWAASRKTEFEPPPVALRSPFGFSVKRSLQRFLQRRMKRNLTAAPCKTHPPGNNP